MKNLIAGGALLLSLAVAAGAHAQCATYPNTLTNGTTADATQVMANFNCAALTGAAHFTGNVGIGTTTPYALLDLGNAVTTIKLAVYESENNEYFGLGVNSGELTFGAGLASTTSTPQMVLTASGVLGIGTTVPNGTLDARGNIYFGPTTDNEPNLQQELESDGPGASMRLISTSGVFLTAGATPNKLSVTSTAACETGTLFCFANTGDLGVGTTSPAYPVDVAGDVRANAYLTNSDARLKTRVATIVDPLATLERLRGVTFMWRAPDQRTVGKSLALPLGERQIGFIAQELQPVVPEAVVAPKTGSDGTYAVDASRLVPILVEAVKAQQAEIAALKTEVADLRSHRP